MEVAAIVLTAMLAPLLVAILLGIGRMLLDIQRTLAADTQRWARQEELWQQNAEEHERAFGQISVLKDGQRRIEAKLDLLLGKNNG